MKKMLMMLLAALLLPTAYAEEPAASHYVAPNINHPDYGDLNIVMPISVGSEVEWQLRMAHAHNAVTTATHWNGHAHVIIVVYGEGIKLLAHHNDKIATQVEALRADGVHFAVCNNSLRGMDLDWHTLNGVAEADIVPAGILEVPYLERSGFFLDSE